MRLLGGKGYAKLLRLVHKFEAGSLPALAPARVRDEFDEGQSGFWCGIVSWNGSTVDNEVLQRRGQQSHQRDAFGRLHFTEEKEPKVRLAFRHQIRRPAVDRGRNDQFWPHLIGNTELRNRAVEGAADRGTRIGPRDCSGIEQHLAHGFGRWRYPAALCPGAQ
jgi:hypothetical protein